MVHHTYEPDIPDTEEVLASIRRAIEGDLLPSPGRSSGFAGILGGDERPRLAAGRVPAPRDQRPLISREAELRTRAAFNRLNESAVTRQVYGSQSIDEAAQDYLRSAIKRWLDDNLPALTERLVREEIERVVRSARR